MQFVLYRDCETLSCCETLTLGLIMNFINVTLEITILRTLVFTQVAHVGLDLVMYTVNVNPKICLSRAFIFTDIACMRLDLVVNTINVTLKLT